MPIPGEPTTLSVAAAAARQAGLENATSISSALASYAPDWFEAVKTQLWMASSSDQLLETSTVLVTTVGAHTVGGLPSDFDHPIRVEAFDGSTLARGVFQNTTSSAVQLRADYSAVATTAVGLRVFTLAGMGSAQVQSIASYNDTTKWATLATAFTTQPTATTTYLLGETWKDLPKERLPLGVAVNGPPRRYWMTGTTTEVSPPSDQTYPLLLTYGANLTRLNDGGYLFTRHLRERHAYWKQGLKVEIMGQYDDDRYPQQLAIWQQMLTNYAGKNLQYTRTDFVR